MQKRIENGIEAVQYKQPNGCPHRDYALRIAQARNFFTSGEARSGGWEANCLQALGPCPLIAG